MRFNGFCNPFISDHRTAVKVAPIKQPAPSLGEKPHLLLALGFASRERCLFDMCSMLFRTATGDRRRWTVHLLGSTLAVLAAATALTAERANPDQNPPSRFVLQAIGRVEKTTDQARVVLNESFAKGLRGLDGFSHVWVIWWFDRNDTPRGGPSSRSTLAATRTTPSPACSPPAPRCDRTLSA